MHDNVALTGDRTLFGPFHSATWAAYAKVQRSWIGGKWLGMTITGDGWTGTSFASKTWASATWPGIPWSGASSGPTRTGRAATGPAATGPGATGPAGTGPATTGRPPTGGDGPARAAGAAVRGSPAPPRRPLQPVPQPAARVKPRVTSASARWCPPGRVLRVVLAGQRRADGGHPVPVRCVLRQLAQRAQRHVRERAVGPPAEDGVVAVLDVLAARQQQRRVPGPAR